MATGSLKHRRHDGGLNSSIVLAVAALNLHPTADEGETDWAMPRLRVL